MIGNDIFRLHHFHQTSLAVSAAPPAVLAAAVRSFRDAEITDGIIDHHRPGSEPPRDSRATSGIARLDAGPKRKIRIVATPDSFLVIFDYLYRQYRHEGFFLKKFHRFVYAGKYRRL